MEKTLNNVFEFKNIGLLDVSARKHVYSVCMGGGIPVRVDITSSIKKN